MNTRLNYLAQSFRWLLVVFLVVLSGVAIAQKDKPAKADATGSYQGTAKNRNEEAINVTFELTEKQGLMSGIIHSDHGDFNITGGKHDGADVTLEFDTNGGPTGTITLKLADDKMSGTWTAGDDGGPVEVKKIAATDAPKAKS